MVENFNWQILCMFVNRLGTRPTVHLFMSSIIILPSKTIKSALSHTKMNKTSENWNERQTLNKPEKVWAIVGNCITRKDTEERTHIWN